MEQELERILVVKLADLGDLLTATPALRALRRRYPTADIRALVTPHSASLLAGNDAVDGVLCFPKADFDRVGVLADPLRACPALARGARLALALRRGRYDAVVLLHHLTTRWGTLKYEALVRATGAPIRAGLENGRGAFLTHRVHDAGFGASHEVDYWTDVVSLLGAVEPPREMELVLDAAELAEADHRWTDLGLKGGAVAVLHPGSGAFSVARRWPPGRFAEVGDALVSHGLRVAVVAGPDEAPLARAVCEQMRAPSVTISAPGSVRVLAAMLRRARLFVGNDSGVMHCAAAVGVPVVAVFGLSNHRAWGPYPPERHAVVRLDLPCSPCLYTGYGLGTPQGCPPRSCLVDLDAETVTASALRLLAASEPRPGEDDGV